MAISRYDQRKNYEESEANAIGTEYVRAEYVRADLLPTPDHSGKFPTNVNHSTAWHYPLVP